MNKQYQYSLRFVLMPNVDVEKRIEDLIRFCKSAKIDDVIFFIGAEDFFPGHITKELAQTYVDVILKAKKELDKLGITTSLNPWCTLVHGDRGRKLLPDQNFRVMVSSGGEVPSTIVCPLGKEWREYYVDYLQYLIDNIHPHTIWLEDDFRLVWHFNDGGVGCFCEEHLKLYAKELGVEKITREEFVGGMFDDKENYRAVFAKVNGWAMKDTLEYIVDHVGMYGTRIALMTSSGVPYHLEGRRYRDFAAALSKYIPTANRLGLGSYRQVSPQWLAWATNRDIMPSRAMLDDDHIVYSEVENAPMTRYIKSAKFTGLHMLSTSPLLLDGATFDIFEFNGNGITEEDEEPLATELARVKPFLQKILDTGIKYKNASGVEASILQNRTLGMGKTDSMEKLTRSDNFIGGVLSQHGMSMKYTEKEIPDGKFVALLPTTANLLTEAQLKALFSEKFVVLPADTVDVLKDRGLGHLIYLKSCERLKERTGRHVYEQICKEGVVNDPELRASCQLFVNDYIKAEFEEGKAEPYTKVYNYDYSYVGDGITLVNGNILVFPYYGGDGNAFWLNLPHGLFHPLRAQVVNYIITAADEKGETFSVKNVLLTAYYYKTEKKDYAILCNYLEDDVKKLVFSAREEYGRIRVITLENTEGVEVPFKRNNANYELDFLISGSSAILLELEK